VLLVIVFVGYSLSKTSEDGSGRQTELESSKIYTEELRTAYSEELRVGRQVEENLSNLQDLVEDYKAAKYIWAENLVSEDLYIVTSIPGVVYRIDKEGNATQMFNDDYEYRFDYKDYRIGDVLSFSPSGKYLIFGSGRKEVGGLIENIVDFDTGKSGEGSSGAGGMSTSLIAWGPDDSYYLLHTTLDSSYVNEELSFVDGNDLGSVVEIVNSKLSSGGEVIKVLAESVVANEGVITFSADVYTGVTQENTHKKVQLSPPEITKKYKYTILSGLLEEV
jgi:hypothetical protein